MRRALLAATMLFLALPAPAFARGEFDPTTEFEQHEWVSIHLGRSTSRSPRRSST
jgi:hypothetical protein